MRFSEFETDRQTIDTLLRVIVPQPKALARPRRRLGQEDLDDVSQFRLRYARYDFSLFLVSLQRDAVESRQRNSRYEAI